ncbi:hypothetical protein HYALB_00001324 [Hymenoscyphus albidus]|uniref:Jacalin-type lectin domain-containing protein n=1 Tax=Hymenoscyphus albidus TaxID=595503 RepID=A0A9N9LCW0_9HELO|nr:hypothetical protein HYALB_00001324 [Hymenoscyphus albidus]
MAPSFLKEIRRRSKSSFRTNRSTDSSNASNNESGASVPTTKSSSTLSSVYGSTTPPASSLLSKSPSAGNLQQRLGTPPPIPNGRPTVSTSSSNRYSVSGMSGLGSPSPKSTLPTSPYAPRILSITDNTWVYQKVLSIYGTIADPSTQALEGNLTVSRQDDGFPPTYWPVSDSHFKALVYLTPGPNRLRFDFTSPKLANSNTSNPIHSSYLTLHMLPPQCSPPLQLVIMLAKDSPGTFDAVPARIEREGNGLDTAIKKFRMAAYLWQAFTAEQMYRNKLGRRVFRMEEEWVTGTSNLRDREMGTMRSEAKVHVVRCDKTVAEIRDLDLAQQNPKARKSGELFSTASEAVKNHFQSLPGQKQYVSVLILDSHWDKEAQMITGHAALGGGGGDLQLAICGSHALQSYPSCIEEVVPAFSDCTPTDTDYVANDCNESGSNWEAANIGIGAHMHETGHLFGCPHAESGVMLRDYVTLNRSFTTREPFSTRTKSKGGLVLPKDECTWHRLDCLRFRGHPCFALPTDPPRATDDSVQVWPVDGGNVIVTATSGVSLMEIYTPGDDVCHYWQEFGDGNGNGPIQKQINLTEQDLRSRLPEERKKMPLKLSIKSVAGGSHEVEDFGILASKASRTKLQNGQMAFRSSKLGLSQMNGSQPQEFAFDSVLQQTKIITQVKVYHGFALDGIEFMYEDSTSQLFGKRGGQPGGSDFFLDTRRGEYITGFYVRSGVWVDGIAIMTSLGRKSAVFGNPTGGSGLFAEQQLQWLRIKQHRSALSVSYFKMVSLWGNKDGEENGNNATTPQNGASSSSHQPRNSEPDERTQLLPPSHHEGFLSPDDPAVTPYNLWSVRFTRYFTVFFAVITFLWWALLLVSIFVSPPGMHSRGSGFFDFSYTTLTLGVLLVVLLFFSVPSTASQVTCLIISLVLLVDMILIVSVARLRTEEGWVGITSCVWALLMSLWAISTDQLVTWGKHEEEERLTGRQETRRTVGEWFAVLASTIVLIVVAMVGVLLTATLILRARDASLAPPGERYYVDGDKYQIHIFCEGNATDSSGKKLPTVLFEAGEGPFAGGMNIIALNALANGSISRYCYSDRPGIGWSDNAPSPFSAGMAADVLSEALARAGEEGPFILASQGVGSIYSRVFSSRHGRDVKGILLIDPLHEDLLYRIGSPNRGFLLWAWGIISPLGLDRNFAAIIKGRTREDRVFGRSAYQSGKFIKARLQESLVANSLTKNEVGSARNIQKEKTPLVVISSGISVKTDTEWEKKQGDLTRLTRNLVAWDIVNKAPSEVWRTRDGRDMIEKRLGELVKGSA